MSKVEELMVHPPTMAEMAGGVLEVETHPAAPNFVMHPEETPLELARLEAETEF